MQTIDERIRRIESDLKQSVPGTQLVRVLHSSDGVEWCLAIGNLWERRREFRGPSIDAVLTAAEQALADAKYYVPPAKKRAKSKGGAS